MDAKALLDTVAAAYSRLRTLSLEFVSTSEDEESQTRNEQRGRAFYMAPDKVRFEQGGGRGSVTVSDGVDLHHFFGHMKRYSKHPLQQRDMLPGIFRPEFPMASGSLFLFTRIAERVASAELLRMETIDEVSHYVLSVSYEPQPGLGLTFASSPLTLWIHPTTYLVSGLQGTISHRRPAHDETHTTKVTLRFDGVQIDEPIAEEVFEFTPPPEAIDASVPGRGGGFAGGGGGGGGASFDPAKGGRFESWHSHDWAGSTLIETSKLRLHGFEFAFERRLTISDDRTQLRVVDRITTSAGPTERELSVPIAGEASSD